MRQLDIKLQIKIWTTDEVQRT